MKWGKINAIYRHALTTSFSVFLLKGRDVGAQSARQGDGEDEGKGHRANLGRERRPPHRRLPPAGGAQQVLSQVQVRREVSGFSVEIVGEITLLQRKKNCNTYL